MDSWDNIRYFIEVARCGSVSAASDKIEVSHSTVLRRIEQLEQGLGVKLFKRLQSGYELTDSGEGLLNRAFAMEAEAMAIERDYLGKDEKLAGTLRVSQPSDDVVDIYPIYAKFIKTYPEIRLEVSPTGLMAKMTQQETDVAIRFTDKPHDLLIGKKIGHLRFRAYAHKKYLQQFKKRPKLGQVDWIIWQGEPLVMQRNIVYNWINEQLEKPRVILQTSSVSGVVSAIRAEIGAGFITDCIAEQYADWVSLPGTEITGAYELWLLTHRDLKHVPRVSCFMRFMEQELRALVKRHN